MDFNLTEEHQLIRQIVKEFCDRYVCPIADEVDQKSRFPVETIQQLAEQELMGIPYPEEYGGGGADYLSYIIVLEELARACATTAFALELHTSLVEFPLFRYGTEEQKKKYLTPLCKGEMLGSIALAEPETFIDETAVTTTAVGDGNEWVLNGGRLFISNFPPAGLIIVFAVTDTSAGTGKTSAFIVPAGAPGIRIVRHLKKAGLRGSIMAEAALENCRIPKENLLGGEGQGSEIAGITFEGSRIGIAAQAVGIAQAALDESIEYSQQRIQFGQPISSFQAVRDILANMAVDVQAARLLTYEAAWCYDQELPYGNQAAMAMLFASATASRQTNRAVQVHGGIGYVEGSKVERLYRDAIIWGSHDGSPDLMRTIIAGNLLR
jgi:butyryl-CoA dehydrogenase